MNYKYTCVDNLIVCFYTNKRLLKIISYCDLSDYTYSYGFKNCSNLRLAHVVHNEDLYTLTCDDYIFDNKSVVSEVCLNSRCNYKNLLRYINKNITKLEITGDSYDELNDVKIGEDVCDVIQQFQNGRNLLYLKCTCAKCVLYEYIIFDNYKLYSIFACNVCYNIDSKIINYISNRQIGIELFNRIQYDANLNIFGYTIINDMIIRYRFSATEIHIFNYCNLSDFINPESCNTTSQMTYMCISFQYDEDAEVKAYYSTELESYIYSILNTIYDIKLDDTNTKFMSTGFVKVPMIEVTEELKQHVSISYRFIDDVFYKMYSYIYYDSIYVNIISTEHQDHDALNYKSCVALYYWTPVVIDYCTRCVKKITKDFIYKFLNVEVDLY